MGKNVIKAPGGSVIWKNEKNLKKLLQSQELPCILLTAVA